MFINLLKKENALYNVKSDIRVLALNFFDSKALYGPE